MSIQLDVIRALLLAHYRGDEGAFRSSVWEIIEKERRVNRTVAASELERILSEASQAAPPRQNGSGSLHSLNGSAGLPKDKDKNVMLLEIVEARRELDDLVLAPATRASLDRVVTEWRKGDLLKAHGLRPVNKLLFYGPPGCGKSVAAETLAKSLYLPLATVKFDALVSSFLGETSSNLRRVFDYARSRPMVLLFDEFDAIGRERTAVEEHGELKRVVNSFLQMLDGFRADTLTIAATNHEGLLDPALWRRFDDVVLFPPPSQSESECLLTRHFRQVPLAPGVKLRELTRSLAGACHADIERVAIDAIKLGILEGRDSVSASSLATATNRLRNRLNTQSEEGRIDQPNRRQSKKRNED
jgi:SpoVK/Ycf46/Vps4 family AAA+-type ATPase